MAELAILGVFAGLLLACVLGDVSILYALCGGMLLFLGYGLWKRYPLGRLLRWAAEGIRTVRNILLSFVLIGVITAVWRICGTIPYIVYYATRLCTPWAMLPVTFLLCSLVSLLTGTAFGTSATVGVICMTMANSMGLPPICTGGAVLAGSYFGDRCSPMSTSALLVAELTSTDLYRNIANMFRTARLPLLLSCGLYFLLGLFCPVGEGNAAVQEVFAQNFVLHPAVLAPAVAIVALSLLRMNVRWAMSASILAGGAVALLVQRVEPLELLRTAVLGYQTEDAALAALLNGGGVTSMVRVFVIICISSCYVGIFKGTGFLEGIQRHMTALAARITPFGCALTSSVVTALISCNQSLTIMLTHQICREVVEDRETMAICLENTAAVTAPLVPWSIACAVPLATVSAPSASVLLAWYLYLIPLTGLISALRARRSGQTGE